MDVMFDQSLPGRVARTVPPRKQALLARANRTGRIVPRATCPGRAPGLHSHPHEMIPKTLEQPDTRNKRAFLLSEYRRITQSGLGVNQTMKRIMITSMMTALVLALLTGCSRAPSQEVKSGDNLQTPAPFNTVSSISTSDNPNFLLLISDQPNDIGDFEELWISVTGVALAQGDGDGLVEETFAESILVNLVGLTGEAAVALWEGYVPAGDYTKVFIYVDEVWGLLAESGEPIEIKLPSGKLNLNLPVIIAMNEAADFVFDITVHRAGNSGQYIVKPNVSESGQGAAYRVMQQTNERVRTSRPEWAGKPDWAGQGDDGEASDTPARGAKPDWASEDTDEEQEEGIPGRPLGAGRPEGSGKPFSDLDEDPE